MQLMKSDQQLILLFFHATNDIWSSVNFALYYAIKDIWLSANFALLFHAIIDIR